MPTYSTVTTSPKLGFQRKDWSVFAKLPSWSKGSQGAKNPEASVALGLFESGSVLFSLVGRWKSARLPITKAVFLRGIMPIGFSQTDVQAPPAIVRPAEEIQQPAVLPDLGRNGAPDWSRIALLPTGERVAASEMVAIPHDDLTRVSNRPAETRYRVIYVNGIHTSEAHAMQAANLIKGSLGVEDCEVAVLYNPPENVAKAGLKIAGASISSRLGAKSEPEVVTNLMRLVEEALHEPNTRLILVGHSQGTLIIQNALDRSYDYFQSSKELQSVWSDRAPRMEVILYAPLVRTIPPGPQAISLLNSYDLPARGLGIFQRAVAASKHYSGYRRSQPIRSVIYNPESNIFPDLLFDPERVHESFQLIIDNPEFNFRLLAEDPVTRQLDGQLFAGNLARSILDGKRSDLLHQELVIMGCSEFGCEFAGPFIQCRTAGSPAEELLFGRFSISGPRLTRLQDAAVGR